MAERTDPATPETKPEIAASPAAETPNTGDNAVAPDTAPEAATWLDSARTFLTERRALAASVALAAVLGAAAGAATAGAFGRAEPAPAPAAITTIADETRALRETVVRLSGELAAMQARIETSQRNATAQIGKLSERLEKANAEPAARLAKVVESLDRLERKVAAAPEVTGSVTAVAKTTDKTAAKPDEVEGWRLREFFGGRAVVENRGGALYEVGPGSSLPGLGRVESIKRQDGRIVVLTAKGQISGTPEPRRAPPPPPRYMHYRY